MTTTTSTHHRVPARRRGWSENLALLIPLAIVGVSGMAISYATLIDVARTNGLPLPELFPVLVDVGTIACLLADAQFRRSGISGRWIAGLTFVALSALSVFANATHAAQHADPAHTQVWVACILAATPPAALLSITHLVMKLMPHQFEPPPSGVSLPGRAAEPVTAGRFVGAAPAAADTYHLSTSPLPAPTVSAMPPVVNTAEEPVPTAWQFEAETTDVAADTEMLDGEMIDSVEVEQWLRAELTAGRRPSGAEVGRRLGKSAKSGQRFVQLLLATSTSPA